MRHRFRILFYVKRNQPLKCGKLPIICRISVERESCTFSTHLAVEPKLWDNIRKRVRGRSQTAKYTNTLLDEIYYTLYDKYLKLLRTQDTPSASLLRRIYLGQDKDAEGIISFFDRHNQDFEKMVGVTRRPSTLYKYIYVCNHLRQFLYAKMHVADLAMHKVNRDFVCGFHRYLRLDVGCNVNTIRTYLTAFKHIMMLAVVQGYISQNPFHGYELRSEPSRRAFLTKEELRRLMQLKPNGDMEAIVQDAFLFSCFTGLAYADIARLSTRDITMQNKKWMITTQRTKTRTTVEVPLLQVPLHILKKYYTRNETIFFGLPSNCWCNKLLKGIATRAQIERRLTFHTARHTFATTITLSYGVPIEAVSRMLGHTDIKTTQIYAKVQNSMVNAEMNRASEKINYYFHQ